MKIRERRPATAIMGIAGQALLLLASTGAARADLGVDPTPAGFWGTMAVTLLLAGAVVGILLDRRWRKRRQALWRDSLDAMTSACQLIGPGDEVLVVNAACRKICAGGAVPMPNMLDRQARTATDRDAVGRLVQAAAAGHEARADVAITAPGGVESTFEVRVAPVAGQPGIASWTAIEVTARRNEAAAAEQGRNDFQRLLRDVPVGVYALDEEGRFVFANDRLAGWLGLAPETLRDASVYLAGVMASPPAAGASAYDPFGRGGGSGAGRVTFKTAEGGRLDLFLRQTAAAGATGRVLVHGVAFELGGEGLTALPDGPRLPYLLDEAPLGVAQLDREGRVEACNAAFHAMAGGGDCLGRPLAELLRAEDRAALAEALPRLAGGAGPVNLRFTGRGERAATLYGASGEAAGRPQSTIAYFVDMTEQRRLEMQFAQSQKMQAVGQLAGGVAHDFNNLLTAMIGFCDLLLLRHRAGDQSFADIMQIKQNGNRAASLVRQLLAFSRQQTLQPRVLAITDVLAELSHLLRRLIGANIELEMTHGRDLYPVLADPSQIEQVIINLAVNARDAMPNGGRLAIRTANITIKPGQVAPHSHGDALSPGDYLRIGVADSGTGIDPVIIDRIFDPFFSTKEVGAGTGLGLATVYGIVKQTGGSIYVDSTPGAGAVFTLYLPRHTGPEAVEVHRREADIAGARRDLTGIGTVLLVEDEDAVRLFGARALRNKGYSVLEARSGEAALEILGQHQETIDLVITDVVMPRMDGPALVRRLRELRPQTKVIFISGYAEDEFRRRLHEESDIHFLPKPFTLKQLASKVKDVLREGEA